MRQPRYISDERLAKRRAEFLPLDERLVLGGKTAERERSIYVDFLAGMMLCEIGAKYEVWPQHVHTSVRRTARHLRALAIADKHRSGASL